MGVELSIVMPCLNEADTLETCIRKAQTAIKNHNLSAEIIVADNGSTDGSQDIALRCGARVVAVAEKGYGNVLRAGIKAAQGQYIIMGDADDSYNFTDIYPFIERLRAGYDLVMGNRFKGRIMPGAMPWKHKWIGNPVLSAIGRILFKSPVGDFHCGLRGFTRQAFDSMDLKCSGMEFASELVVTASLKGMKIAEVPITLYKDGRKAHAPHLRSWRDGWRHLRFMLLYSPRWLFLIPGIGLFLLGLVGGIWLLPGPRQIGSTVFDVHTLLVCGLSCIVGFQLVSFAVFSKTFGVIEGFLPKDRYLGTLSKFFSLEAGLIGGAAVILAGVIILVSAVIYWSKVGFGALPYETTMRLVIPATVMITLGVEIAFSSFLISFLGLPRKEQ